MSASFLVFACLFPRWTLFLNWMFDNLPHNDTPFWADVICSLFFPRFLTAYWAHNLGEHVVWVAVLVLLGVLEILSGGSRSGSGG